jgi:hypothetical protein
VLDDSGGTLREIPISSINGIGLDYPEQDLTAFQDAIVGVLPNTPDAEVTITGPFDTTAAAAAAASGLTPVLSGSHTILSAIVGGSTPLALAVLVGMRHLWETGEPAWGLNYGATSGFLCLSYKPNLDDGTYEARFKVMAGSSAPSWLNAIPTS